MNVQELIKKLKTFPADAEVYCPMPDYGGYDWQCGIPEVVKKISSGVWIGHDVSPGEFDEDV